MHVDYGLGWGASVSLGAGSEFVYCNDGTSEAEEMIHVVLRSGDVLVANFGKLRHSLVNVLEVETAPTWWKTVETFGRARCNIQLRDTSMYKGPLMTKEQHRQFLYSTSV